MYTYKYKTLYTTTSTIYPSKSNHKQRRPHFLRAIIQLHLFFLLSIAPKFVCFFGLLHTRSTSCFTRLFFWFVTYSSNEDLTAVRNSLDQLLGSIQSISPKSYIGLACFTRYTIILIRIFVGIACI